VALPPLPVLALPLIKNVDPSDMSFKQLYPPPPPVLPPLIYYSIPLPLLSPPRPSLPLLERGLSFLRVNIPRRSEDRVAGKKRQIA
jgi:hypothetical protein